MLQLLQLHSGGFNAETSIISCPGCAFLGPPLTLPYRKHCSRLKPATYETRVGIFPQGMNALIGFHVGRFKLVVERKRSGFSVPRTSGIEGEILWACKRDKLRKVIHELRERVEEGK